MVDTRLAFAQGYASLLTDLKQRIRAAQARAALAVRRICPPSNSPKQD
jgi:hypothetical protein